MMAHECPECGITCHCGGDVDDLVLNEGQYRDMCRHCPLDQARIGKLLGASSTETGSRVQFGRLGLVAVGKSPKSNRIGVQDLPDLSKPWRPEPKKTENE